MKKILSILSAFTVLICMSCDNEEEHEHGNGCSCMRPVYTQHCILSYIQPTSSTLDVEFVYNTSSTILNFVSYGANGIRKRFTAKNDEPVYDEKFLDYAMFYNDMSYNGTFPSIGKVYDCTVVSRYPLIKIEAVTTTDFNDNYPANSSLNEIGRLVYLDGISYIANNYGRKYDENGELIEISEYYELLQEKRFNDISAEESIALLDIQSSYIKFDQQPSKGEHVIQFKFTFGPDPVTNETIMPVYADVVFTIE